MKPAASMKGLMDGSSKILKVIIKSKQLCLRRVLDLRVKRECLSQHSIFASYCSQKTAFKTLCNGLYLSGLLHSV